MITKDQLKKEIEGLPEDLLDQIYQFIKTIKRDDQGKAKIRSFKLKGQFDNINIHEKAYK
ncbi:MAG: hypothetical protein K6U11_06075 [bacterium]|nr:hypothetical protein [bacterium]